MVFIECDTWDRMWEGCEEKLLLNSKHHHVLLPESENSILQLTLKVKKQNIFLDGFNDGGSTTVITVGVMIF